MRIVLVVALISWLALGVLAVGLLGVAKMLVRFSARAKGDSVAPGAPTPSSVDAREGAGRSFAAAPPPRHPGTVALPPPSSRRLG